MQRTYYVYILQSISRRVLYIGFTGDLEHRLFQHKTHYFEGFAAKFNCERMVYFESFGRVVTAIEREKQLKRWTRRKKEWLITLSNPHWKDLSAEWWADLQRRWAIAEKQKALRLRASGVEWTFCSIDVGPAPRVWHNGTVTSNNHSLRAVVFDYGRVLSLPPSDADWAAFAAAADLPLETLMHRYWGFRDGYDRKEVKAPEYWSQVVGRELAESEVTELIAMDDAQWTRVNPEMLGLARELKEAGLKIAILSNMQVDMLRVMRAKFEWLPEFDVQMYSCEVGIVKPKREIYLECAERLGVEPSACLFLDDKDPNVRGAEVAGMHALLFHGERKQAEAKLAELGVKL